MATKAKSTLEDEFTPKDYKLPESSGFMKFIQGKNKFRALSSLVTGYVYWRPGENGKDEPVRSEDMPEDTSDGKIGKSGKVDVNHFWMLVVWDYASESVKILEITQKGVQKYIIGLLNDQAWGSPKKYDIVVTRDGEGLLTKYTVAANPHKELSQDILDEYAKADIDLEKVAFGE